MFARGLFVVWGLVACGAEGAGGLEPSSHVDGAAVYVVVPGNEGSSLRQLDGDFMFEGAPRSMSSPTIVPFSSALLYSDLTGSVFEVAIERGRNAMPISLETECPGQASSIRVDASSGALVYSCLEGVGSEPTVRRGAEVLPSCPNRFPPIVVDGERMFCREGLLRDQVLVPFDALIDVARRGSGEFLAELQRDDSSSWLVSVDDEGNVSKKHEFAAPPSTFENRRLFFIPTPKTSALSAGGRSYRIGRLDDPNIGPQIVFSFDAQQATPVAGPFPADPPLYFVTGP